MSTPNNDKSHTGSQFSPVTVAVSPAKSIPQRGNLTGNVRRFSDISAEIYNSTQMWKVHHLRGARLLNDITESGDSFLVKARTHKKLDNYPHSNEEIFEELDKVAHELKALISRLDENCQRMRRMKQLANLRYGKNAPLFLTWPIMKYEMVADKICDAYKRELEAKMIVKENIAYSSTREELMYYLITWVHEPYIDSQVDFLLESLLRETGHR